MAIGLKSRIIARIKTKDFSEDSYWAGNYTPLGRAKSIPSPYGDPNMVDTSTLEDWMEAQEEGRRSAPSMDITIAFEKASKDSILALEGKVLDIIIMYGTNGKGSEGVAAFTGTVSFRPDEATEDHLTATVTVAIATTPSWIEDDYSIATTEDSRGYLTSATLVGGGSSETIALDKATLSMVEGSTDTITATVRPSGASVVWSSSDSTVASVNRGVVSALDAGTATITATNGNVSATCTVTVTAEE